MHYPFGFTLIQQLIITFKLTFFKEVSGDYLLIKGISLKKWQRCRCIRDGKLTFFYEPKHCIHVFNDDFHFEVINVTLINNINLKSFYVFTKLFVCFALSFNT